MQLTANKRFVWHVCPRNPFLQLLLGISIIHALPQAGSWERQHAPPPLHCGGIMPIPSLQLQEKTCLMQRSIGWVTEMNSCRDWAFSICGLETGLPAFQLPMFAKCDAVPNEIWSTCSFKTKTSIAAIPFWNVLQAWGSWEQYSPSALPYGCIMPIPSLQLQEKTCLMQRSIGLVTELWPPRFVSVQWLCSQLCYVTAANQWTVVGIELLATVGWKWGCPCSLNATHCQHEICLTCLSKESIPATPFGNFNHPVHSLPQAGSWVQQHAPTALHYGCIMPIPSLQLHGKTCLIEISRGFCYGVVVSEICYNAVIVLSVVLPDCCKPMNSCRDWAFSNSGLEVGLSMFVKCNSLPTRDLFDMFVQGIHPCNSFWEFQSSTPYHKQVPECSSTLQLLCIMVASCPSLRCSCMEKPVSCREA